LFHHETDGVLVYLILAVFWIVLAVVLQIFWDTLERHAFIPIDRTIASVVCFVLSSYNFLRWRLARAREQLQRDNTEPPSRPRREYDPTLDFSDPEPTDEPKRPRPD
jgi:hypothetical protein